MAYSLLVFLFMITGQNNSSTCTHFHICQFCHEAMEQRNAFFLAVILIFGRCTRSEECLMQGMVAQSKTLSKNLLNTILSCGLGFLFVCLFFASFDLSGLFFLSFWHSIKQNFTNQIIGNFLLGSLFLLLAQIFSDWLFFLRNLKSYLLVNLIFSLLFPLKVLG